MQKARYHADGTPNQSVGMNFIRLVAPGGSCQGTGGAPGTCIGYGTSTERMPYKYINGEYKFVFLTPSINNLDVTWRARLKKFIKQADRNGISIMISLFDENTLTGSNVYARNPWHPNNNDLNDTTSNCLPSTGSDPFPEFYQLGTSNCVDDAQEMYVKSVVKFLKHKNLKICGDGTQRCKNVIVEIMNEAVLDDAWDTTFLKGDFKNWHTKVANWVKFGMPGGFMVSASVKGANIDHCVSGSNSLHCLVDNCTKISCTNVNPPGSGDDGSVENPFYVFTGGTANPIDIYSAHSGEWALEDFATPQDLTIDEDDICERDSAALIFEKPVIFDDDGLIGTDPTLGAGRNCNIEKWAQGVSNSATANCGQNTGKLHFYHTKDGVRVEGSQPTACQFTDDAEIDCQAWNGIADGFPTDFCSVSGSTCQGTRVQYCENGTNGCPQNCSN
jgi:hypothetical protein